MLGLLCSVFGVAIEVTVQRQESTRPIPFILIKCADYLILTGKNIPTNRLRTALISHTFGYRAINAVLSSPQDSTHRACSKPKETES